MHSALNSELISITAPYTKVFCYIDTIHKDHGSRITLPTWIGLTIFSMLFFHISPEVMVQEEGIAPQALWLKSHSSVTFIYQEV